jgi:hypothetical protein
MSFSVAASLSSSSPEEHDTPACNDGATADRSSLSVFPPSSRDPPCSQKEVPIASDTLERKRKRHEIDGGGESADDDDSAKKQRRHTSRQNNKRKKRKGARGRNGNEEDDEGLPPAMRRRIDYYRRLLHSCQKDVHRNLKEAKKLECTKVARDLKKCREKSVNNPQRNNISSCSSSTSVVKDDDEYKRNDGEREGGDSNDITGDNEIAKSKKSVLKTLETRYVELKRLDVQRIVAIVLRRLGIVQINPEVSPAAEASSEAPSPFATSLAVSSCSVSSSPGENALAERMLRNKRMRDCLEKWNDQVTEYRRWCLRYDEKVQGGDFGDASLSSSSKKKRGSKRNLPTRAGERHRGDRDEGSVRSVAASFQRSVFVKLGGDDSDGGGAGDEAAAAGDDEPRDPDDYYGPSGSGMWSAGASTAAKKNRPGQRARKAKAEAIRAKEQGVIRRTSLNWREPKKKKTAIPGSKARDDQTFERKKPTPATAPDPGTDERRKQQAPSTNNYNRQDETAHPSWQAASLKVNTGGIVPFRGTKITF